MHPNGVKEYWNLRAQSYDEFYNAVQARQQLLAASSYFLNSLRRRYDVCADLGCGTGRLTESLALVSNKVLAVDIAEDMLRVGKRRLSANDFESRIEWIQKDVIAFLQERDSNSIDICAAGLLTHQMNPAAKTSFIAECHRALRNTGDLFLTEQVVCDETIDLPAEPVERRKVLYDHIVSGFYRETGPPPTFRDDFEYTDTATELFERLRRGGFTDIAFYALSPIVGMFAAKKRSRDYIAVGFPALKYVSVKSSGVSLPGSLAERFEILQEEPAGAGRRIVARHPNSGQKVVIELGTDCPEYSKALAQQKDIAELLRAHEIACAQPLEYAVEDNVRFLVVEQPEGLSCTPDIIGRLSLYEILKLMRDLLRMHQELAQLGMGHTAIPDGLVLKDDSSPIISDLRRLQPPAASRLEAGEESGPLHSIGQLIAEALRRHTNRFIGANPGAQEGDLLGFPHSLPTKLAELLRNLISTPPPLNADTAIMQLDRFLGFRPNRSLSVESSIMVNKEFISVLEFETMPPKAWTWVWALCRADQRHRDLLYAVLDKYASVYSNSNLFGILVTHDYEEFQRRTRRQASKLRIRNVILDGVSLRGWRLEDSEVKDCRFQNCDFSEATFRNVQFVNCDFAACSFAGLAGEGSYMVASQFYECNLTNAALSFANLERSKIVGCVLTEASLEGANLHSATVTGSIGIETCNLRNVNAFNVDDDAGWRKALARVTSFKLQTYPDFEDTYSKIYGDRFQSGYAWLRYVTKSH